MGAGRYVGRVGGLAVALGIGTAILAGAGVASATTESDDASASSDTDSAQTTSAAESPNAADAVSTVADRPDDSPQPTAEGGRHQPAPGRTPSPAVVAAQTNEGSVATTANPASSDSKHDDDASTAADDGDNPSVPTSSDDEAAEADATVLPSAATPSTDIRYTPTVGITDNVITGTNTAPTTVNGNPIRYYVVGAAADGGKMGIDPRTGNFGVLPYQTALASGSETYTVLAGETTPLDLALIRIPMIGTSLVVPILLQLYQTPLVNELLAPAIGRSLTTSVTVTPSALNTTGGPLAFTTMVTSFDGTRISMNYFPASGLTSGQTAPTVFNGSGAATRSVVNPYLPNPEIWLGVQNLRDAGYNVVTWDPRGEFYSGGLLNLDSAQFEGRDVKAMIDFVAGLSTTRLDAPGDPRMGMVGGSYGGAIQLVTAATDTRVDAIAPQIAWNDLTSVLAPYDGAARTSYSLLLLLNFVLTGARLNPAIAPGILLGVLTGRVPGFAQSLVDNAGPGELTKDVTVPTLLIQGIPDPIFPLEQSLLNAAMLEANGVPLKMLWYCGGHGTCLTPPGDDPNWAQQQALDWMDKYVMGEDVDTGPAFQWVDQNGDYFSSNTLPTDAGFYGAPLVTNGSGSLLPIVPVIGGSGPSIAPLPYSLGDGAPAGNAVRVPITNPTGTTEVVGAPTLTMSYAGVGIGRVVYAQIVDRKTGLVVGNQVSPVPVTLDGREHTVTVPLASIVYTMDPDSDLELQIVGFATAWASFTQFGAVDVKDVRLELPTAA